MNTKDVIATNYMSVNHRFADAINVGIFQGKQIVLPNQIEEIDTASRFILKNKENTQKDTGYLYRDVLKTIVYHTNFCIVGVENQSEVHYVFPVRSMLYDAATYKKQWNQIKREHKKKKDLKGAEFLSGFSKQDKLHAVVTLIVYFGTESWNGARDIHSLIDWSDMPEELKNIIPNYPIYLLELNKYENLNDFQSDLKVVCRFLQNSNDDKKLEKMMKEHREEFEDMEEDTYDLIGTLGNMSQVKEMKSKCKREDGGYNMCKGMDDWLKRKENEGLERGIALGEERGIALGEERGIALGEERGIALGEERGIAMAKRIFKLSVQGKKVEEIAELCEVSIEKVQQVLE